MGEDLKSNSIVTVREVPQPPKWKGKEKIPPRSYYMLSMIKQKAFTDEEIVQLVENAISQQIGAGCGAKLVKLREQK